MTENKSFHAYNVKSLQHPVLLSVPHAGREYSPALTENLAVPTRHLLRLEDRLVDRLASSAISNGIPTIIARQPRAWIDLNRHIQEIDPATVEGIDASKLAQPSRKVRGGLGLVPSRLSGAGNLWKRKWQWQDISDRIETVHRPYHEVLEKQLKRIKAIFGCAILLDLHSMPSLTGESGIGAKIVVGDRFGRSSAGVYSDLIASFFDRHDISVQLNHPYPGGYLLERHGNPARDIHALQLEVDRACYLDTAQREPNRDLTRFSEMICQLVLELGDQLSGVRFLQAAE